MSKNRNYNPEVTEEINNTVEPELEEATVVSEENEAPVEAVEPIQEEAPEEKTPVIIGVVTGCTKLNVRKGPSVNTESLAVIEALDNVVIAETGSTSAFYKVRTKSGIDGYCMKKFISIK